MFENLTVNFGRIFDQLTKRGVLRESDIDEALREVRVALLDADVALLVVKDLVSRVRKRAVGAEVFKSVTPGQMVVKIVHEELINSLGEKGSHVNLAGVPPVAILVVGLQGSGKTTTSAKLGLWLTNREKKRVLLASLDVYRPAAQRQLAVLGEQTKLTCMPYVLGEQPVAIAKRAMQMARLEAYDVIILDTAGRLHIDTELMAEVAQVRDVSEPVETLLVADAMTGQDSVNLATEFNEKVGLTGIVLTRVDGDARGGAALSMRAVTDCPVKFMGTGEAMDALEVFDAERLAGSILGMGDIVGLVEKAQQVVEEEDAERIAKKMLKGQFTLEDMAEQLRHVKKMGSLEGLMGMMPGAQKIKNQLGDADINDKLLVRQEAIILSMTVQERRNPKIIKAARRKRIAAGSGTTVQDVNKLLKQYKQLSAMMKKAGKMGKRGLIGAMGAAMGGSPMPTMPRGSRFG